MPLSIGDKLGPYEILAPIGKGGMGEVYRAHDSRLNRDVAIKVSAAQFSERFEREAKAIAALNHPNICQIYDVGPNYLVMEYIEGESPNGPMPLDEALRIARQIAHALEAAHDKGITHRDLKPSNIKIKPDGTVKVLDFGLAKISVVPGSIGDNSPTLTMGMTQAGMILGSAAYMAPEQARGKESVDKRADIWAFGVVLYELLTGKRMFTSEDVGEILAKVIRDEPDLAGVPAQVTPLLKRCLEKDPKKRLRDIGDAWALLVEEEQAKVAPSRSRFGATRWMAATGVALVACAILAFVHFREAPPEQRSVRFQIPTLETSSTDFFKLSPDGRLLAFTSGGRLWIRPLDSLQARPLPGTEGAGKLFWSPDSQFVAFFAQGKLQKIAASGGPAQVLCSATEPNGGTWNQDGVIVFPISLASGLFRVSAAGGAPVPLAKPDAAGRIIPQILPEFLPDGRHFLYWGLGTPEEEGIYAGSLDGTPATRLLPDSSNASYVQAAGPPGQDGYLLFRRGETLMAQRFNPTRLSLSGDASPIAEKVGGDELWTAFSVSENGTLVYAPAADATTVQLIWKDRTGKQVGLFGPPGIYRDFRLAPDEKRIAFANSFNDNRDVWVLDSVRGVTSRLTFDPAIDDPAMWSPDGLRVVWASNRAGTFDLYVKSANGAGPEQLLVKMGATAGWPEDWSRDGRFILYQIPGAKTGQDLWIAPQPSEGAGGDSRPFPYLETQFDEKHGRFSPDSNWVAYTSNESGREEVYVQSFPPSGAKFLISTGGGREPQWRKNGTELFYISENRTLMAVPLQLASSASKPVQVGQPKPLFRVPVLDTFIVGRSYEVGNDGQRFLMPALASGTTAPPLTVVLNWQTQLKK
jgi:eukaryotic-like serine/threonine-protein kinase